MRFVGVDLAWKVEPPRDRGTGLCVLADDGAVERIELLTTDQDILAALPPGVAWVGVDASLKMPEGTTLRRCERGLLDLGMKVLPTSREFYQRRYGGCRGETLGSALEALGYEYFGTGPRRLYEVYPYAVLHVLSGGQMPRYKKGPREARLDATAEILRMLRRWCPSLHVSDDEIVAARGSDDRLDALVGAVLLYQHRLYRGDRTRVVGDDDHGYILLPRGVRGDA